jgi:hypothetical protein
MGKALRGKRAFSNWYVKTYYSLKNLYALLPAEPGKWKYLSLEMMTELWIAREKLKVNFEAYQKGGETNVPPPPTWAQYCRDIKHQPIFYYWDKCPDRQNLGAVLQGYKNGTGGVIPENKAKLKKNKKKIDTLLLMF